MTVQILGKLVDNSQQEVPNGSGNNKAMAYKMASCLDCMNRNILGTYRDRVIGDYFFGLHFLDFKANGSLWNWLQLLSGPVFVSALPLLFKGPSDSADHKVDVQQSQPAPLLSNQQSSTDLQIEDQHQQESVIESYLNTMSTLLLDKGLRSAQPGSDVQEVAQALTLTVLRRVDKSRQGAVLQFLHEAGLIYNAKLIIDLSGADLHGADLSKARLNGANLLQVDLSEANLSGANLKGAIYTKELSMARSYNNLIL